VRECEDDYNFPDEIDVPTDIPLRERFKKYRGLKKLVLGLLSSLMASLFCIFQGSITDYPSFKTTPWDPYENLPIEYAKIFDFQDFKRTRKRLIS